MQFKRVQYSALHYSTVQLSSVQLSRVQYSAVQYSAVENSAVLLNTVQCSLFLLGCESASEKRVEEDDCLVEVPDKNSVHLHRIVQYRYVQYTAV